MGAGMHYRIDSDIRRVFNSRFSVAFLTNMHYKNVLFTLQKRCWYANNLFVDNIKKNYFSSLENRCRYAVPACTVTKNTLRVGISQFTLTLTKMPK